jgi:hypothetical protein
MQSIRAKHLTQPLIIVQRAAFTTNGKTYAFSKFRLVKKRDIYSTFMWENLHAMEMCKVDKGVGDMKHQN